MAPLKRRRPSSSIICTLLRMKKTTPRTHITMDPTVRKRTRPSRPDIPRYEDTPGRSRPHSISPHREEVQRLIHQAWLSAIREPQRPKIRSPSADTPPKTKDPPRLHSSHGRRRSEERHGGSGRHRPPTSSRKDLPPRPPSPRREEPPVPHHRPPPPCKKPALIPVRTPQLSDSSSDSELEVPKGFDLDHGEGTLPFTPALEKSVSGPSETPQGKQVRDAWSMTGDPTNKRRRNRPSRPPPPSRPCPQSSTARKKTRGTQTSAAVIRSN